MLTSTATVLLVLFAPAQTASLAPRPVAAAPEAVQAVAAPVEAPITPVAQVSYAPVERAATSDWISHENEAKAAPVAATPVYTVIDEFGTREGEYDTLQDAQTRLESLLCTGVVWYDGAIVSTHVHYPVGEDAAQEAPATDESAVTSESATDGPTTSETPQE